MSYVPDEDEEHLYESIHTSMKIPQSKLQGGETKGYGSFENKRYMSLGTRTPGSEYSILSGAKAKWNKRTGAVQLPGNNAYPNSHGPTVASDHQPPVRTFSPLCVFGRQLRTGDYMCGTLALASLLIALISLIMSGVSLNRQNSAAAQVGCNCPFQTSTMTQAKLSSLFNQFQQKLELAFLNCTTSAVSSCHFPVPDKDESAPVHCETDPIPMTDPTFYVKDLHCGISDSGVELANPVVATLLFDNSANEVRCNCYVNVSGIPRDSNVTCSFFVTRCPVPSHHYTSN